MHRHLWKKPQAGEVYRFCACGKRRKAVRKVKDKTLRNKCDAAWSRITKIIHVKKRGPICLWCKKPGELQSDHIINRWKTATRWAVRNCVVLCMPCHLYRKKREPLAWAQLVQENVPADVLEALEVTSREPITPNYEAILAYLEACEKEATEEPQAA